MQTRRGLAQQLGVIAGFADPAVDLEQYTTSPELAANIIHVADLNGDLDGQTVIDLGAGTGMLTIAAALRGPDRVIGVEVDREAIQIGQNNEHRIGTHANIEWLNADATTPGIAPRFDSTTVVMNPPFGAQTGNAGADRRFLATARKLGSVSYSVHNAESRSFVEAYATDNGGTVTHAFEAELPIDRQFQFHKEARRELPVEVFRIAWTQS